MQYIGVKLDELCVYRYLGGFGREEQITYSYKATYWGIFCGEKHMPDIKSIVNCVQ